MTNKRNAHSVRRMVAALGAAVVASLGITAVASAVDPGTIDSTKLGSISITKYKGDTGVEHDGTEIPVGSLPTNPTVEGAEFTLYPVTGYDLTTNAGWTAAETLINTVTPNPSKPALEAAATLGAGQVATTDINGQAKFDNLPLGLYYAVESKAPAGLQPIKPFLVTLPMSNPAGTGWMYDIFIYPKDAEGSTKTPIDYTGPKAGETLVWKINALIRDNMTYLKVRDDLDINLQYQSVAVAVGGLALSAPTDYTLSTLTITPTDPTKSTRVEVEFTAAGLATLKANAATSTHVTIDVTTKVSAGFNGVINNKAYIFNNEGSDDYDSSTPPVDSKYGEIIINKVAHDDQKVLPGAEFDVYSSTAATFDIATATKVNTAKLVTDANGVASLSGLRWSTFAGGKDVAAGDAGYIYYWLVETKAPNGFQTLAQPIAVELNAVAVTKKVENNKKGAGIELPFTGGTGTIVFMISGLLLVAGATMVAIRRTRGNSVISN